MFYFELKEYQYKKRLSIIEAAMALSHNFVDF